MIMESFSNTGNEREIIILSLTYGHCLFFFNPVPLSQFDTKGGLILSSKDPEQGQIMKLIGTRMAFSVTQNVRHMRRMRYQMR